MELITPSIRQCWDRFRSEFPDVYQLIGGTATQYPSLEDLETWYKFFGIDVPVEVHNACEVLLQHLYMTASQQAKGYAIPTTKRQLEPSFELLPPAKIPRQTLEEQQLVNLQTLQNICNKDVAQLTGDEINTLYKFAIQMGIEDVYNIYLGELCQMVLLQMMEYPQPTLPPFQIIPAPPIPALLPERQPPPTDIAQLYSMLRESEFVVDPFAEIMSQMPSRTPDIETAEEISRQMVEEMINKVLS